ncbi:unnamed protein product [Agarophyton chilense]
MLDGFLIGKVENTREIFPMEGAIPSYDTYREALDSVETELSMKLREWQTRLPDKTLKFYYRGREPYQLEIKLETVKGRTIDEFEVVSKRKTAKRFYTTKLKGLFRKHKVVSEDYEVASTSVARYIMGRLDQEYKT